MYVYQIVLDPGYPLDSREYRGSQVISLEEALWIFGGFPFEEPEYYQAHPEEGPPPQVLFAHLGHGCLLVVRYLGQQRYELLLSEKEGRHYEIYETDAPTISEAIRVFWQEASSARRLTHILFAHLSWQERLRIRWQGLWLPRMMGMLKGFSYILKNLIPHAATAPYARRPLRKLARFSLFSKLP